VYSIRHWQDDNQFLKWELYVLGVFVICAAIFEIKYLNKALTHFSTSIVTPVSYVFFSTLTILTSAILFRGFNVSSFVQGGTIMAGFLVIVIGVALLFQYNLKLNKLKQELQRATSQATMDPVPDITDILDEPETDQNPISLMVATFPFRRAKRRTSNGYLDEFMTPTADVLPASQIEFRPPSAVASRKSPVADTTIEMSLSHPSSSTSSVPNRTDSADHLNNSNVSMMKLNEL
jgi:hypothetical protein